MTPAFLRRRWQRWLARRHPAGPEIRLRHNRIYVLPSAFGFAFALCALLLLVGAINYQLSLGYLFTFGLIGLGHAALTEAFRNLLGLRFGTRQPEPVFQGETAFFPVAISNDKRRVRRGILLRAANGGTATLDRLAGQQERLVHLPVPTSERGWLALPRLTIETRYPTGFCRAWSHASLTARVLVYPRPERDPPPYPGAQESGAGMARRTGEDEFAGLREYRPGDSPRRIAWKHAARSDILAVKSFDSAQGAQSVVDWDAAAPLDVEGRLSRLTAWLLRAEGSGERYGLNLPGQRIEIDHGPQHLARCLEALATFDLAAAPHG
ncbi:hypothetical protein GCM10007860_02960 [Chitiniphilus shinanonensis]|uniref:DUF58 domain-containing protein n=1 Tax=Chitiniphilus shinanonensis TaxID=553088 RepID=A0ABQ6BTE8_9NEIS|nr:DUF58 domain-containing protein [Chitiniphilus shinanonensis]GLS03153.1 hypothetical protein GCM10007860_02960 [Chitiniphilus shinanonensis]